MSESVNWQIIQKVYNEKYNGKDFNESNTKVDDEVEFEDLFWRFNMEIQFEDSISEEAHA